MSGIEEIHTANASTCVASCLSAEDIRVGDYLALLTVTYEYPSFLWCGIDTMVLPPREAVFVEFRPLPYDMPLRVKSICLPFVFAKSPTGNHQVIDVRQHRLAKVDSEFAADVWKAEKSSRKDKRQRKKKRKKH